jgi:hypothetical protein
MRWLTIGLCALALGAAPPRSFDYTRINRPLVKEPAYQSRVPQYGLLLFGPEARLRVWVVLDGDTIYLDRNGDGDLTGKEKRFAKPADWRGVELADPDGKTRYRIEGVGVYRETKPSRTSLLVNVAVQGPGVSYRQYCDLNVKPRPREACIAHFHGPLTAGPRTLSWKVPPGLNLVTGDKPTDLNAVVGTMSAKHGCWVVARSHNGDRSAFAKGVCPVVEIEFPPKAPGGPAVKKRYLLDKFC